MEIDTQEEQWPEHDSENGGRDTPPRVQVLEVVVGGGNGNAGHEPHDDQHACAWTGKHHAEVMPRPSAAKTDGGVGRPYWR